MMQKNWLITLLYLALSVNTKTYCDFFGIGTWLKNRGEDVNRPFVKIKEDIDKQIAFLEFAIQDKQKHTDLTPENKEEVRKLKEKLLVLRMSKN